MKRLEQLKTMIIESPDDPFLIYGLALEYRNVDLFKAKEVFDDLLERFPDYLPTYYQSANLYEEIDEERAIDIYKKGMELAQSQKNMHAFGELKSAYEILIY